MAAQATRPSPFLAGNTLDIASKGKYPRTSRTLKSSAPVCGRRSAKIAGRKGKADLAKAKIYGKIGKLIAQAVRSGGADVLANARLRDVLQQAKLANVPNDIIERNMKKASDKSSADYTEVVYEAYGPGGTGFVIECLTDNVNRSNADVRLAITKGGGKPADQGSVLFNFQRRGLILVNATMEEEDSVFEAAMDAGAADMIASVSEDGTTDAFKILADADEYASVLGGLRLAGLKIDEEGSGLIYVPLVALDVDDEAFNLNEAMFEKILAVDDVDAVYANCSGLE